jgi:hypothetical protein
MEFFEKSFHWADSRISLLRSISGWCGLGLEQQVYLAFPVFYSWTIIL